MVEYVVCRDPGDTDGDGYRVESVRHRVFRNERHLGRNVRKAPCTEYGAWGTRQRVTPERRHAPG